MEYLNESNLYILEYRRARTMERYQAADKKHSDMCDWWTFISHGFRGQGASIFVIDVRH